MNNLEKILEQAPEIKFLAQELGANTHFMTLAQVLAKFRTEGKYGSIEVKIQGGIIVSIVSHCDEVAFHSTHLSKVGRRHTDKMYITK